MPRFSSPSLRSGSLSPGSAVRWFSQFRSRIFLFFVKKREEEADLDLQPAREHSEDGHDGKRNDDAGP